MVRSRRDSRRTTPHSSSGWPRTRSAPARRGWPARCDGSRARASAERGRPSSRPISPKQVACLHQGEHALAAVDRAVGDGDAAVETTTNSSSGSAPSSNSTSPRTSCGRSPRFSNSASASGVDVREEVGGGQQLFVGHGEGGRYYRRQACPEAVWTIVVAAGAGSRFGGAKQFDDLGGRRVVDWAVEHRAGGDATAWSWSCRRRVRRSAGGAVAGGDTRAESVRGGLARGARRAPTIVVRARRRPPVRRGGRCSSAVVAAVRAGADGAVPARRGRRHDQAGRRRRAWWSPRPTAPRSWPCRRRRRSAPTCCGGPTPGGAEGTDDAALVEAVGGRVVVVAGEPGQPQDHRARRPRVGRGSCTAAVGDARTAAMTTMPRRPGLRRPPVHRRPARRRLVLGGVEFPRVSAAWSATATPTSWPTPSPTPCSARPGSATSASTSPTPTPRWARRRLARPAAPRSPRMVRAAGWTAGQRRLQRRVRGARSWRRAGREMEARLLGVPPGAPVTREGPAGRGPRRDRPAVRASPAGPSPWPGEPTASAPGGASGEAADAARRWRAARAVVEPAAPRAPGEPAAAKPRASRQPGRARGARPSRPARQPTPAAPAAGAGRRRTGRPRARPRRRAGRGSPGRPRAAARRPAQGPRAVGGQRPRGRRHHRRHRRPRRRPAGPDHAR